MNTKQVLIEARVLIEKGWCQHIMHMIVDGQDCYCMTGALDTVTPHDHTLYVLALTELQAIVRGSVVSYNDTNGRTKEQVLEVFDGAIRQCRD